MAYVSNPNVGFRGTRTKLPLWELNERLTVIRSFNMMSDLSPIHEGKIAQHSGTSRSMDFGDKSKNGQRRNVKLMRLALDWNTASAAVDVKKGYKPKPLNDYVKNQKRYQTLQTLRNSLKFDSVPALPEISDSPSHRKEKCLLPDLKVSRESMCADSRSSGQEPNTKLHALRSSDRQNAILPIFKYRFTDPVFNRNVVLDSTKQIKEKESPKELAPVKVWRPELQCVLVSNKKALHNRYYEPGF